MLFGVQHAPPNQISHFSINADDVDRACAFYSAVFDWSFTAWGPPGFFLIDTGGIVHGALQRRGQPVSGEGIRGYECTVSVADVDVTLKKIVENGGTIKFPKSTIPTVGDVATFFDTEGNYFCIAKYEG